TPDDARARVGSAGRSPLRWIEPLRTLPATRRPRSSRAPTSIRPSTLTRAASQRCPRACHQIFIRRRGERGGIGLAGASVECVLFVAAALLALLPFRSTHRWKWRTLVAVAGSAAAVLGWFWSTWLGSRQAAEHERLAHTPLTMRQGFASSDACRAC